jgi:2-keto-4-pentenoate hydratase/2-oxohepta-3-ene-1,7-dioic acid hydratase in catechol pathway
VTPDEIEAHRSGDRLDLDMRASLNGAELGSDTLANIAWSFEELVAHASRGASIAPGDVIGWGTWRLRLPAGILGQQRGPRAAAVLDLGGVFTFVEAGEPALLTLPAQRA